jgi:SAM-dependent methyltransferase
MELFHGIRDRIDFRIDARREYEARVASKDTILDVGGRNHESRSNRRLRELSANPNSKIVATDILPNYNPDIVDDICDSKLESSSFDAIYCDAILEHVKDYEAAIRHMHRILKPGGELFVYVPFFWTFHDYMDYHRFTFTEVDRMLGAFSGRKLFLPDGLGYGGVFWQLMTFYQIDRTPRLRSLLATCVNSALAVPLTLKGLSSRRKYDDGEEGVSLREFRFFYTHLHVNHGFCAWAKKSESS